ncbi:hypothetical protein BN946_scf184784.g3 [Trametes cinnabarina]|uniref:Uncharacterized protein n=1 Tax=Pycnoporus cinnabarinus TaxID=5643 RepID=A0A060S7H7_PYCCI|nr:hypothetical protein BN946_scf184784.g3 [Trametes cinnabarina]
MSSTTSTHIDSERVLHNQDTWIDHLQSSEKCAKLEDAIRRADVSHDIRRLNATIEEMKNDFRKLALDFAIHDRELKAIEASRPENSLKPLKPQWDRLRDLVNLGITVLGHLSTGAISAGMLFLKLSPDTVQSVLTSLMSAFSPARAASSKLVKTMKLKKAVREGERTLAALQRKYGAIKFLEESLVQASVNVDGLAARIDGIANIW